MIEIVYAREKERIKYLPQEVQETILGILDVLDSAYGKDRLQYEDNGGYVVIIEKSEDFQELKMKTYIDVLDSIPEYVDLIKCSNGAIYTNSLIISNNDYAISLIIPMELTPENLKNYMID